MIDTGGGGFSSSETQNDASAQTSGNITGNSNDRVSQQFFNISGAGSSNLDLNSYLGASTAGFYNAIAGEQKLEAGLGQEKSNTFKYVALGAGVLVALVAVVVLKGRK